MKKIWKVKCGEEKLKIIIEDPSGNSGILSDKAKQLLDNSHANIIGSILNNVNLKNIYGYYKNYYYYQYYKYAYAYDF